MITHFGVDEYKLIRRVCNILKSAFEFDRYHSFTDMDIHSKLTDASRDAIECNLDDVKQIVGMLGRLNLIELVAMDEEGNIHYRWKNVEVDGED